MKLRLTLAAILAGALAAPGAFAQPADHKDRHDDHKDDKDRHDDHKDDKDRHDDHKDDHKDDHHGPGDHAMNDHRDDHRMPPPVVGEHGRREWKVDRPVVTSYSALRGEPGAKVVIRGKNFGKDTVVVWGGNPIAGATIGAEEISFVVPKGAANGTVFLRGGGLAADLAIGDYEVAKLDKSEWQKREDARKAEAQAAWEARAKAFNKDRKERDAELARQEAELEKTREERRQKALADMRAKFERAFLNDPATQAELVLHAQRQAELERAQRVVADVNDAKLGVRVEVDIRRENERHDQRMAALKAAFKGG